MKQLRLKDGTRIAYTLRGPEDGATVLLLDGISCDGFIWAYLQPALEEKFRVLHLNYRGHGLSGLPRDPLAVTLPHLARDIDEVMASLGLDSAICIGHSMGVQVAIEFTFRYPRRVRAGVLICGSGGRLLDTFKGSDMGTRLVPHIRAFTERFGRMMEPALRAILPSDFALMVASLTEPNMDLIRKEDLKPYLDHMATMQPELFARVLNDAACRSSRHFLKRITQPMLVVAGERDGFTPAWVSQVMAGHLGDATYVELEAGSHTAPLEHPDRLHLLVSDFIETHKLGQAKPPRRQSGKSAMPLARRFKAASRARRA